METENTTKKKTTTSSTKKSSKSTTAKSTKATADDAPIVVKEISPDEYVVVRNGFQGKLIYVSPRTRERFVWNNFGDEQEMTLRELRSARNSCKGFFKNNWFMFDEPWIIDYLSVKNFYRNAIPLNEFDNVFTKSPEEITELLGKLSAGQKQSLSYRARELIRTEVIDSRKVIAALEKGLGVELIER